METKPFKIVKYISKLFIDNINVGATARATAGAEVDFYAYI